MYCQEYRNFSPYSPAMDQENTISWTWSTPDPQEKAREEKDAFHEECNPTLAPKETKQKGKAVGEGLACWLCIQ